MPAAALSTGVALLLAPPVAGDDEKRWFQEEIQPHERSLRAYLRVRFPTLDADDLIQDTYTKIFKIRRGSPVESPKSLLFTLARNVAISLLRHENVVTMESMADLSDLRVLVDSPDAAESACHAQEIEIIKESISDLPERCRQVMTLRLIYGLRHKEIAQQLGISEHTVNNQLTLGLERCRRFLSARDIKSFPSR